MRYFGSKASTIEDICDVITRRVPTGTICDPFGGIGTVGARFKQLGYAVWSGDILRFAHFFQVARVARCRRPSLIEVRRHFGLREIDSVIGILNSGSTAEGWFVQEYARNRRFFTEDNAFRIQSCINMINDWAEAGLLKGSEYAVLVASLVNSMDRVANTAGTYYAYLKSWQRKSLKPFRFEMINPVKGTSECRAFLCDATDLVGKRKFDVLYLDPPYNRRSYARYYHLPETIVSGSIPNVHGLSGMPDTEHATSAFACPATAYCSLSDLLKIARFHLLVFHYADDGLIPPMEVRQLLSKYGQVEERTVSAKGYTTISAPRSSAHRLYLVTNA